MRLSISAKIFAGYLIVLTLFLGVLGYGAWVLKGLGDELRLVARGYLELRLEVNELQTSQSNLLKVLVEQTNRSDGLSRMPRWTKSALDDLRRIRVRQQLPAVLAKVKSLEALRTSQGEQQLLQEVRTRLEAIGSDFAADEPLFDKAYGAIGAQMPVASDEEVASAQEKLFRKEQSVRRGLANLGAELRLRTERASLRLDEEESRAVWATLTMSVLAAMVGLMVIWWAARTLRPLRAMAERAKEIARGDYRERVDDSAPDEIGALGREFNSMAGALEEREQRLIRSERLAAAGQIAAQITHEVRNPLSSIGLNAELLEEEVGALQGPPERIAEAQALVRAIVKEVDRLSDITEQYLRFVRLPKPRLEREDLGNLVASLVEFLRGELQNQGVTTEVHCTGLPLLFFDEAQIRQALLNLFRNAKEAMPQGGKLLVTGRVSKDGRYVELRISDTGQGIDVDRMTKIFDPFFTTKEHGTGLGLALTQQIMGEHGGSIDVESEVGRGTIFTLNFPIPTTSGLSESRPSELGA